jgi:SHS2 domain-containing protein
MENSNYEEIEHQADMSLRIHGRTWAELLQNAAISMSRQLAGVLPAARLERRVSLASLDRESLLVDWLNEINFTAETERLIFSDIRIIEATSTTLLSLLRGDRVDRLQTEIKAVTYHNLVVFESANGFEATLIFDI